MIQVDLQVQPGCLPLFFPLFEKGVVLPAEIGCSVRTFVCGQLGIADAYLDQRVQTLFLDARPVDNVDAAVIRDGATLALSAAMPGLLGATMRKGGRYAAFRRDISQCTDNDDVCQTTGRITLKLFNMVASELGGRLLEAGVEIDGGDLKWIADRHQRTLQTGVVRAFLDSRAADPDEDFFSTLAGQRLRLTVTAAV